MVKKNPWILIFAGLAVICGRVSEEERVARFLDGLMALAEKRNLPELMEHFSPDYSDFEGRDTKGTEALIGAYFARSRGIIIHHLGTTVELIGPEGSKVSARTELMLSSGAGEIFRRAVRLAGEYYRFELILKRKQDESWQIEWASWEALPVSELLPESLAILKKLFPDG